MIQFFAALLSKSGEKIGQAAVFNQYELEDGTVVQVTSEAWQPARVDFRAQYYLGYGNCFTLISVSYSKCKSERFLPYRQIELPPSEEDILSAEAAVEEQAAVVRSLKEGQGRTNQVGWDVNVMQR